MTTTPAGPYTPGTPTLGGVLDHAAVHQHVADDVAALEGDIDGETSARIAADNARQVTAEKGQPNGYPTLDGTGKVPASQLPAAGGPPTGPAGGSLAGSYPNPTLAATAVADLNGFTSTLKGVAPASGGGTATFLRADGTWAAPPAGSALTVQDEGSTLSTAVTSLNFTGAGVTASGTTGVTVNVPSGGGGGTSLTPTSIKTANYTAAVGDDVLCNTVGGFFTVTLPPSPSDKAPVRVTLLNGDLVAGVAVAAGAGDTLNDTSSIAVNNKWSLYQYQASTKIWYSTSGVQSITTPISSFAAATAFINMGGNNITNLPVTTVGTSALSRDAGDARYLQPTALHSNLLATKVWSGSAYVWPGTTAPDANSFTNIVFIDPTGTHDPKTSTGGRNVANDLWETGTASSGSAAGALLATKTYNPGTATTVNTTSGTFADIDATNLVVTFTAPASGQVIVRLESGSVGATTSELSWNIRESTSDVGGTAQAVHYNFTGNVRLCKSVLITGLTAGSSHTYKWGHARTSGSGTVGTLYGGGWGQAVMEVWAA
jgi:hypothetical protein